MQSAQNLLRIGTTLIFTGFLLIIAGIVFTASQQGNGQFAGLIMIGPIPIAFGSTPQITSTMLLSGLAIMLIYLFMWRKMR